ncbi:MAG: hypothetical protein QXI54_06375 [Archaeoglobaceae archaeon]
MGIGDSNLSAWIAYYIMREKGFSAELVAEVGFYGYSPRPANPFVFNTANIPTCKRRCFYCRRSCGRFETFSSS